MLCDAGGAEQDGNDKVPHGPTFFSTEWRALYKHALSEAHRLGLEMSLNILSGWNLGGPMVRAEDAAKKLVWSEVRASAGSRVQTLPMPAVREDYYKDVFVVAYRIKAGQSASLRTLKNWEEKTMHKALHFSAPDTRPLLVPGVAEVREYRAMFWDKGQPSGEWCDVAKITVSP